MTSFVLVFMLILLFAGVMLLWLKLIDAV